MTSGEVLLGMDSLNLCSPGVNFDNSCKGQLLERTNYVFVLDSIALLGLPTQSENSRIIKTEEGRGCSRKPIMDTGKKSLL